MHMYLKPVLLKTVSLIPNHWIRNHSSLECMEGAGGLCVSESVGKRTEHSWLFFNCSRVWRRSPKGVFSYQIRNSPDSWQLVACGHFLLVMRSWYTLTRRHLFLPLVALRLRFSLAERWAFPSHMVSIEEGRHFFTLKFPVSLGGFSFFSRFSCVFSTFFYSCHIICFSLLVTMD